MKWTKKILSRVHDSVTNNNGFWIGWLDLLTPSFTITSNHNQLQEFTVNLQPNPSSLTAEDSLHSRSRSTTDFCQSRSHVTTGSQSASLFWCQAPIWDFWPDFYYCQTAAGLLMWGALSDERTGLSFTTAVGPRQRSHSRVRVPWDSWPYFTVSDSILPKPGEPGPRIYIPQELGSLFIASYDSQGYVGGIRTHLHAGLTEWLLIYGWTTRTYVVSRRTRRNTSVV
jgi:hypothetical protein